MSEASKPGPDETVVASAERALAIRTLREGRRWSWPEIAFWIAALSPFVLLPQYQSLAAQIAVTALFALSVDLILGYAGIVTLGHAMFFGIGAYAAGLLGKYGWGEPISAMVAAGLVAGVVGYVTSFVITRVQHLALLMITLGLGLLTFELANSMTWLTGGDDGLRGVEVWPLFGVFEFDLWGTTAYAYTLAVLFLAFLLSRRLVASPFGLSLRGIRENTSRMPAIGSPYRRHMRRIFTISTVMAGMAGALLTQTVLGASLQGLSFQRSADIVVMLVLGGSGRLYGAVVGVIVYMIGRDQLSDLNPQYWYFWIGLLLMAVVLVMPKGLLGSGAELVRRARP